MAGSILGWFFSGTLTAFASAQNGGSQFCVGNGWGSTWLKQQGPPFIGQFMGFQQSTAPIACSSCR